VVLLHDAAPQQSGSAVAAQQRQDGSRRQQQQQQQTADCRNSSGDSSGCGSSSGSSSGSSVTKQTAWMCGPVIHAARRTETMQIRETIAVCVVKIGAAFVEIE
jgi:hypothetical protein